MFNETPVVSSTRWALLCLIGICTMEQEQQHWNTAATAATAAGTAPAGASLATAKGPREKEAGTPCTGKPQGCSMSHRSQCFGTFHYPNHTITADLGSAAGTDTFIQSLGNDGLCCCVMVGRWEIGCSWAGLNVSTPQNVQPLSSWK